MRILKFLAGVALAFALVACGGGGGSPGTPSGSPSSGSTTTTGSSVTALFTTAPTALTLASGVNSPVYSIKGGVAPYAVSTDAPALISVLLNGTEFSISAKNSGTAVATVVDSVGVRQLIAVTVPTPEVLFTDISAMSDLSVGTTIYTTVFGGTPFAAAPLYTVNSSNPTVVRAALTGSSLAITGLAPGSATIAVSDSKGKLTTVSVVVPAVSSIFTDAPNSLTIAAGAGATFAIFGGTPAYTLNNLNPSVVSATVTGTTLAVSGVSGGNATLVISDSKGSTKSISVTVPAPGVLFTNAPLSLTIAQDVVNQFVVSGGTPPYKIVDSAPAVVSATLSGSSYSVKGLSAGTATLVISDANNSVVTVNVTVPAPVSLFTTAPSSITMPAAGSGLTLSYAISGGFPGYSVTSSNSSVVSVAQDVIGGAAYKLTPLSGGSANISIKDAKGTEISVVASVPLPPALLTTAPTSITLVNGGLPVAYTISGGTPISVAKPYSVVSSNASVVVVVEPTSADGKFTLQGLAAGSTSVEIRDNAGVSITLAVTVPAPGAMFTTAPSSLTSAVGSSHFYSVLSGTKPYSVKSSNPAIATAVLGVNGSDLTITGVSSGAATVAISDALGSVLSVSVVVPTPNAVFTDAPAGLSLASGNQNVFSIYGGTQVVPVAPSTAKYNLTNSNPAVVDAVVSGTTLTLTGRLAGTAVLNISDAAGQKTTLTIAVSAGNALFTTAPSTLTVVSGQVAGTYVYAISGGTKDVSGNVNYTVTSSNKAIVSVATRAASSQTFELTGVATGTANIVISDSSNNTLTIAVTVPAPVALFTSAPASLAVAMGPAKVFGIFGGKPSYTIVNTNPSVVSGSLDLATGTKLSIIGSTPGTGSIIISDNVGASVTISVTVTSPGKLFTSAPAAVTVAAATGVATFSINGGAPVYTVSSSNVAVAAVSMPDATTLRIQGGITGSASITVTDLVGATVQIAVTVPAPDALYTNAPGTIYITQSTSPFEYAIAGGYPPYSARSADAGLVTANVVGVSGLTISAVNSSAAVNGGSTSVVVTDSRAQSVTIQVKVGSSTALFTNAPMISGSVTISLNSTNAYMLNGGTVLQNGGVASYWVNSTNSAVVDATVVGPVLTVVGKAVGTGTIEVTDAVGTKLKIDFVVGTGSGGAAASIYPTLTTILQTSGGVATNLIDAVNPGLLQITMKDPSGVGIAGQVVSVTGDVNKLSFPDGNTALTNASGIATLKVARASLLATGAGAMTVTYDYKPGMISVYSSGTPPAAASVVTTYVGYQVTTANISLANMSVGTPANMAAYGTRQVSVRADITAGGVTSPATSTPITVSFSANCGQVIPATQTTDSTGTAVVTYSATDATGTAPSTLGCSGKTVQITASTSGATAVSQNLTVDAAPATNISFVSASPARIYLANSGGATQSVVQFKLVNDRGEGLASRAITLTLKTVDGGNAKASFSTLGNVGPVPAVTDASGLVSVPVFSGTVPTSVIVKASLDSNPTIQTDSSILVVSSGRPVQSRLSLAFEKLAIEGMNVDGTTTTATLSMADRQGNPVPDGTPVNFTTENGIATIPNGTCVTVDSKCTVTIRSQGTRPANGLVTILAYTPGEEDFVDANANNNYDNCEVFTDLALAYRDDSMTGAIVNPFVSGSPVPRSAETNNLCPTGPAPVTPTTTIGDRIWGAADVRKQGVIVVSTSAATISFNSLSTSSLSYTVADANPFSPNSMPTGTAVSVSVTKVGLGSDCTIASGGSGTIPNTLTPITLSASFGSCKSSDLVTVTVTSPLGMATSRTFVMP